MRLRSTQLRLLALLVAAVLGLAACDVGGGDDEQPAGTGAEGEAIEAELGGEFQNYRLGIFEDTTTSNFWAYMDPESSVWNGYVLAPTKSSFFTVTYPVNEELAAGGQVIPALAAGPPVEPRQQGGKWVVEQRIRTDAKWSDGRPITAKDFAFTVQTVHDLKLGGNWLAYLGKDATGIEKVEAPNNSTVRITFSKRPGLGVWPNAVGVSAPWMAQHFWQDEVAEAKRSKDPATKLYSANGRGDPSAGPAIFDAREEGAFARNRANEGWFDTGTEVKLYDSGAIEVDDRKFGQGATDNVGEEYETGPFWETQTFSLYGDQNAAVLALRQGEVDYLLNPLGMQRGLQDQVQGDANLQAVVNPTYGFRYLAFNLRKPPMNNKAFRQALATMIDRDFMAENVLQGVAFPLYTMMPEGNAAWYRPDKAQQLKAKYTAKDEAARLTKAVQILKQGGFRWQKEPRYNAEETFVEPGVGLRMPNGQPVPSLEILAPPPGYDPLRATYSTWIEQWARQLGIAAQANPTGFNIIIDKVFTTPPAKPTFDMYILGWSLGSPTFPDYYHSFWHSSADTATSGGNNSPGFRNKQYDRLAERFMSTRDEEEAKDLVWQMEEILAEELPYVVLFDTPILEFYRSGSLAFPFTNSLGGLQQLNGMPELVQQAAK